MRHGLLTRRQPILTPANHSSKKWKFQELKCLEERLREPCALATNKNSFVSKKEHRGLLGAKHLWAHSENRLSEIIMPAGI